MCSADEWQGEIHDCTDRYTAYLSCLFTFKSDYNGAELDQQNYDEWECIAFSDESHFYQCPEYNPRRIWRRLAEHEDPIVWHRRLQHDVTL